MTGNNAQTPVVPVSDNLSWDTLKSQLQNHPDISPADYASWIDPLTALTFTSKALVLAVPTRFIQDWVEENFQEIINTTANKLTGTTVSITYEVQPMAQPAPAIKIEDSPSPIASDAPAAALKEGSPLNTSYTFDQYITGKSNEMAYAVAESVSKQPAAEYNPLVFFGGVGLGKTHLMHATAWAMQKQTPKAKVLYLSAEQFLFRFIRSLQNKNTLSFKNTFRNVDLLLIDDVQFIAGKGATQEEFFHTFNALVSMNKQIILTSDRSPQELDKLEDRLKSRLSNGLTCEIHPPEFETRLAILNSKAERMGLSLSDEIFDYIATHIVSNIRELEGALNRLNAYSKFAGSTITLDFAKQQLKDLCRPEAAPKQITVDQIQQVVASYFNIRLQDMLGKSRKANFVKPRQIAMYLAKQHTPLSYPELGRQFSNRDHSTVMHAANKVQEQLSSDPSLQADLSSLKQSLSL